MKNESCLRWDSNPRHSVLQTDALPTELPRQLSWQDHMYIFLNQMYTMCMCAYSVYVCIQI